MRHQVAKPTGGHRAARRVLRSVTAAALGAALVGGTASTAGADLLNPTPVGRSAASAVPVMARTVSAQALAEVTCRVAEAFSRTGDGSLYRLVDSAPATTTADTMSEVGRVGSGWTGKTFAWVAAGGDGVVYALTWRGELKWFRYNAVSSGWMSGSGRTIGTGFAPRSKIINIALGGDGSFYVVRANRQLAIYRHTGRLSGSRSWATSRGWTIGTGWTSNEIIIPNGDGTVYRQYAGKLYWYRHSDPTSGPVTWARRKTIGSGWKFYDVLSAGGGVLYATQGGSGAVLVYRHGDPVGGGSAWTTSRGVRKTTVRPNSYGIAVDPIACSLSS